MPTYQYACTACSHQLEVVQSFSDPALTECPDCSGRLRKLYTGVGVVFKGSGFYRTDSRAGAGASTEGGSQAKESSTKSESSTSSDSSSSSATPATSAASSTSSSAGSSSGSTNSGSSGAGSSKAKAGTAA